ncbi:MAG TPA: nuclear transport factor 2 family protein, partial [Vicinamibacterales bacterium]
EGVLMIARLVPSSSVRRIAILAALVLLPLSSLSGQQQNPPTGAQPPSQAAPVPGQRGGGRAGRPPSPPEVTRETATGPAVDVFALEAKIDDAIVKGDAAFLDGVLAKDAVFVLDDHWDTDGRSPMLTRAQLLARVRAKAYLVHTLDGEKIEIHPTIAITYGRHIDLPASAIKTPDRLTSSWFERVYALRDGQWQLLSDRVIHGPTPSPAGIDPTTSDGTPTYGAAPVWFLTDPAPPSPAPKSADEKEVLTLDQKIADGVTGGDTEFVRSMTAPDFSMVHGDLWIKGGRAALRDTQESMLSRVTSKAYQVLDFNHMRAEMHDDVAITTGRYLAKSGTNPARQWFSVWFERVFQKQNGKWLYLSHRTVHGPLYGPDQQSVSDK